MTSDEILALQAVARQRIARLRELPGELWLMADSRDYNDRGVSVLIDAANAIEQMLEDIDAK